jgi:hypothetical protein
MNDFNEIPHRFGVFLDNLYTLVAENRVPMGGYIIENTKSRGCQNILYEVFAVLLNLTD